MTDRNTLAECDCLPTEVSYGAPSPKSTSLIIQLLVDLNIVRA